MEWVSRTEWEREYWLSGQYEWSAGTYQFPTQNELIRLVASEVEACLIPVT